MQSSAFAGLILSDLEAGVRAYHDMLRWVIPVMALAKEPAAGQIEAVNASLLAARADLSASAA